MDVPATAPTAVTPSRLRVGAASVDITPREPQWLDGYGNRTAPSEGAYQQITVKAVALDYAGDTGTVILSAEVLGFDRARVSALKQRIAKRTAIPAENVILTATHTHCAPRVCDMMMPGSVDPAYLEWFEERCVEAAATAQATLTPGRISISRTEERLGINRRVTVDGVTTMLPNSAGPRDRDVDTLWLQEAGSDRVVATITAAGCHPTCRGGQLIGGDYPGFFWREVETQTGGVAVFILGCAGDVRPNFTDESGRFRASSLAEVEAGGLALANDVLRARAEATALPCEGLQIRRRLVEIPLAAVPEETELRALLDSDPVPARREWARQLLETAPGNVLRSVPFEIQSLTFVPALTWLFWPGEVVSEYALWAKAEELRLAGHRIVAGAYANGAVGYVPSAAMYPLGGYEVAGSHPYYRLPAPYAPDVEDHLRTATEALLKGPLEKEHTEWSES